MRDLVIHCPRIFTFMVGKTHSRRGQKGTGETPDGVDLVLGSSPESQVREGILRQKSRNGVRSRS